MKCLRRLVQNVLNLTDTYSTAASDFFNTLDLARNLGATFVDLNIWIRDVDFGRDGLRLNRNGARQLDDFYSRVCGIDSEIQVMSN